MTLGFQLSAIIFIYSREKESTPSLNFKVLHKNNLVLSSSYVNANSDKQPRVIYYIMSLLIVWEQLHNAEAKDNLLRYELRG